MRDAVLNAYVNARRKKGKPFRKLWNRKAKADKQQINNDLKLIKEIERVEKGWIELIKRGVRA